MKIVERGAALLDERHPGWEEKIDTETLDVSSTCNCVLGQLYNAEHPRLRHKWDAYGRKLAELGLSWERAGRFGFAPFGPTRLHNLTAAWRRLVEQRQKGHRMSAAYCAHPTRCGSDGRDCCHSDCPWSPENIQRRLNRAAQARSSIE